MSITYKFRQLLENVLASCLEVDEKATTEVFLGLVLDVGNIIRQVGTNDVLEALGEEFTVGDVFTQEEIRDYVLQEYGIDVTNEGGDEIDARYGYGDEWFGP